MSIAFSHCSKRHQLRRFNDSWLQSFSPLDVVYSNQLQRQILDGDKIDAAGIIAAIRSFNFQADLLSCQIHRRGFIYTSKYCLYWRITYQDKNGDNLISLPEIINSDQINPTLIIDIHSERNDYEENWIPNFVKSDAAKA